MQIDRESDLDRCLELLGDEAHERLYTDLQARARWVVAQDAKADAQAQLKAKRAKLKDWRAKVKESDAAIAPAEKKLAAVLEEYKEILAEVDHPYVLCTGTLHTHAKTARALAQRAVREAKDDVRRGEWAIKHTQEDIEAIEAWIKRLEAVEKPSLAAWLE